MRKIMTLAAAAALTLTMSVPAFAMGHWQSDNTGKWWLEQDGTYPAGGWAWIDGNGDGIPRSFYFNSDGYLLTNTTTPDGWQVDAEGRRIVDLNAEIEHIRKTYAYTNAHIGEYEKTSVNKNPYTWDNAGDNIYFYAGNVQVKQNVEREGLHIEVYGKNPALVPEALPAQETYPEQMAEFVFAVQNGAEYRIYMKDEMVIRYIGPDHVNVDYARPIDLNEFFLVESGKINGGDVASQIVYTAFPGWWVPYEGEGD